jgi:SAM-dependent methyltransferase
MDNNYPKNYLDGQKDFNMVTIYDMYNVLSRLAYKDVVTVLELGCGMGRMLKVLNLTGYQALGVDNNDYALEYCQYQKLNVEKVDVTQRLPFDDKTFDAVISLHLLSHCQNFSEVVEESVRVAKKVVIHVVPLGKRADTTHKWLFQNEDNIPIPHGYNFSRALIKETDSCIFWKDDIERQAQDVFKTGITQEQLEATTKVFKKSGRGPFTIDEAKDIAHTLGIDFKDYDVEQFRMGLDVELEHGRVNMDTNVTDDDPVATGKIALAHLREGSNYYTLLAEMEKKLEEKAIEISNADDTEGKVKVEITREDGVRQHYWVVQGEVKEFLKEKLNFVKPEDVDRVTAEQKTWKGNIIAPDEGDKDAIAEGMSYFKEAAHLPKSICVSGNPVYAAEVGADKQLRLGADYFKGHISYKVMLLSHELSHLQLGHTQREVPVGASSKEKKKIVNEYLQNEDDAWNHAATWMERKIMVEPDNKILKQAMTLVTEKRGEWQKVRKRFGQNLGQTLEEEP